MRRRASTLPDKPPEPRPAGRYDVEVQVGPCEIVTLEIELA
jgi:hypothetical protein